MKKNDGTYFFSLFYYLQDFWISSINDVNAILHSAFCDSLQKTRCIILNSSGLAFFNSPRSNCTSSSIDSSPLPSDRLSCSCFVKLISKSLSSVSPIEQLNLNEYLLWTSILLSKVTVVVCLWFQYSVHWWWRSRASIAWHQFRQNHQNKELIS